mmetsp:Transcript_32689/g.97262  ORF Transcript_32689/g.97262 Transcript_32689/m.97262 type:complete len:211 (+) Transcript_32689:881-1513(+)
MTYTNEKTSSRFTTQPGSRQSFRSITVSYMMRPRFSSRTWSMNVSNFPNLTCVRNHVKALLCHNLGKNSSTGEFIRVVQKLYSMTPQMLQNSSLSISPLPSWSHISKSMRRSAASMSKTRSQWRNSTILRAPSFNSSYETPPLASLSIFWNIWLHISFSLRSSDSISLPRLTMSFSRTSAKVSTTTAVVRFRTPKTSVSRDPRKMIPVQG